MSCLLPTASDWFDAVGTGATLWNACPLMWSGTSGSWSSPWCSRRTCPCTLPQSPTSSAFSGAAGSCRLVRYGCMLFGLVHVSILFQSWLSIASCDLWCLTRPCCAALPQYGPSSVLAQAESFTLLRPFAKEVSEFRSAGRACLPAENLAKCARLLIGA